MAKVDSASVPRRVEARVVFDLPISQQQLAAPATSKPAETNSALRHISFLRRAA